MSSKRLRLDLDSYAVPGTVWHVNAPTFHRRRIFADPEMAAAIVESLRHHCAKGNTNLLVYCVMPDHIHAVISITERDLVSIMHGFKSYTTTVWRRRSGQIRLWQESFRDHGVRRAERMDELVKYVVENPQRAGLVPDWREYLWLGGSLLEEGSLMACGHRGAQRPRATLDWRAPRTGRRPCTSAELSSFPLHDPLPVC